jgi:hypothetical protein
MVASEGVGPCSALALSTTLADTPRCRAKDAALNLSMVIACRSAARIGAHASGSFCDPMRRCGVSSRTSLIACRKITAARSGGAADISVVNALSSGAVSALGIERY